MQMLLIYKQTNKQTNIYIYIYVCVCLCVCVCVCKKGCKVSMFVIQHRTMNTNGGCGGKAPCVRIDV
jgi:hypothetical protein